MAKISIEDENLNAVELIEALKEFFAGNAVGLNKTTVVSTDKVGNTTTKHESTWKQGEVVLPPPLVNTEPTKPRIKWMPPGTYEIGKDKVVVHPYGEYGLLGLRKRHPQARVGSDLKPAVLISPKGEIHVVANLSDFARQKGLQSTSLSQLLKGRLSQTKGWQVANKYDYIRIAEEVDVAKEA